MRKARFLFFIVLIGCCSIIEARAQHDSSWLDLGNLQLKRDFTQFISIKGEELEKMPFANLGEAVNAWLYGAYSNSETLLYVIDGNPFNDVNVFNIEDIDEIIFIQDALVEVNGITGQQQLVLITTKRNRRRKTGLTISGQFGLVNRDFHNANSGLHTQSNNNAYHQYYASAFMNLHNMSFGVSANYLRDVLPSVRQDSIRTSTPYNLNRLRLSAYIDLRLTKNQEVHFGLSYAPQKIDSTQSYPFANDYFEGQTRQRQHLITPWARWHSELIPRLNNELQASYLSIRDAENSSIRDTSQLFYLSGGNFFSENASVNQQTDILFIRDHISYQTHLGSLDIESSLNASFEHAKLITTEFIGFRNSGTASASEQAFGGKGNLYFLSPALRFGYKNIANIQLGLLDNLSPSSGQRIKRIFRFTSLCADILKWGFKESRASLKIFTSYAQGPDLSLYGFGLNDLSSGGLSSLVTSPPLSFLMLSNISGNNPVLLPALAPNPLNTTSWIWDAGASWHFPADRLEISFNFERRYYLTTALIYNPSGPNGVAYAIVFPEMLSSSNHLQVMGRVIQGATFSWRSGINITSINSKSTTGGAYLAQNVVGDFNSRAPSWTGGWVNRLQLGNFSLGIDLLYHFNQSNTQTSSLYTKVNSMLLHNIYFSYRLSVFKERKIDLYIDSRDFIQGSHSDLTDDRRYYTLGGKLVI